MLATPKINPFEFALSVAKGIQPKPTTQQPMMSYANQNIQQPQAIFKSPVMVWWISSPFWAPNINSNPIIWWAVAKKLIPNPVKVTPPSIIPQTGAPKTITRDKLKEFLSTLPDDNARIEAMQKLKDKWYTVEWNNQQSEWVQNNSVSDALGKAWLWVAGTIAWLWWLKVWWELLQWVGKAVYKTTMPPTADEARAIQSYEAGVSKVKPVTSVDTALESSLLRKWNPLKNPQINLWMFWTKSWIGVQAKSEANNLFTENIAPIFAKENEKWTTFKYSDLIAKARDNVNKAKNFSIEEKKSIIGHIDEIAKEYKWNTTLENLDLVKRDIANKLPAKYYKWGKMTTTLKDAQWYLADAFRNTVHDYISANYWVNSSKIYKDYANLQGLAKMWQKAMSAWGTEWAWWLIKYIAWEIATPITTTAGKLIYKIWWVAKAIPDSVRKWSIKWLKAIVKKGNIFTALEDWSIIPWSPTNLATQAMQTPKKNLINIKWTNMSVDKSLLKYDKYLKKKVVKTDIWTIDENGDIIN